MLKEKLKMMNGVLENGNYQLGQFQFAVLVPAGFGAGTPQQEAVPKGQEFSRIENLWPRDDSCSHLFRCVSQFSHFTLLADC